MQGESHWGSDAPVPYAAGAPIPAIEESPPQSESAELQIGASVRVVARLDLGCYRDCRFPCGLIQTMFHTSNPASGKATTGARIPIDFHRDGHLTAYPIPRKRCLPVFCQLSFAAWKHMVRFKSNADTPLKFILSVTNLAMQLGQANCK